MQSPLLLVIGQISAVVAVPQEHMISRSSSSVGASFVCTSSPRQASRSSVSIHVRSVHADVPSNAAAIHHLLVLRTRFDSITVSLTETRSQKYASSADVHAVFRAISIARLRDIKPRVGSPARAAGSGSGRGARLRALLSRTP